MGFWIDLVPKVVVTKWWYCHTQKCNNKHLFWKGSIHGWWWTSKLYMSYIRFLLSSSESCCFHEAMSQLTDSSYPQPCSSTSCLGDACLRLPAETDRTSLQSRCIQLDVGRYRGETFWTEMIMVTGLEVIHDNHKPWSRWWWWQWKW